ncbi:MAG: nucleotidyltransferase substrate binding protein [Ignavibacteria bacterium]
MKIFEENVTIDLLDFINIIFVLQVKTNNHNFALILIIKINMINGNKEIRWEQRFVNYKKALSKLSEVAENKNFIYLSTLSNLEKEGLIQRFEYTFELAWKTLQNLLRLKGYTEIAGPNSVIEQAFADGYITNGENWRKMKKSRELTSHTYNEEIADEIAGSIIDIYHDLLENLKQRLEKEIKN